MKSGEPRKIAKKSKEKLKTKAKRERKSQTQKLPLKSTLPNTQCNPSPLDRYYHVSSLNHPVSKEFN
jgi:hypothetical protein